LRYTLDPIKRATSHHHILPWISLAGRFVELRIRAQGGFPEIMNIDSQLYLWIKKSEA